MPAREASLQQARAARALAARWLQERRLAGAVGLAREGEGFVLKVSLPRALPAGTALPEEIGGLPVRMEVVGEVRPRGRGRR